MTKLKIVGKKAYANLSEVAGEFAINEPALNQLVNEEVAKVQNEIDELIRDEEDGIVAVGELKEFQEYKVYILAFIEGGKSKLLYVIIKVVHTSKPKQNFKAGRIYTNNGAYSEVVFFTDNFLRLLKEQCNTTLDITLGINQLTTFEESIILHEPGTSAYYWLFSRGMAIGRKQDGCLVFDDLCPMKDRKGLNELTRKLTGRLSIYEGADD